MPTDTRTELAPRLINLFIQAGLLKEGKRTRRAKPSLGDVMKTEVSISGFRNLMTADTSRKASPLSAQLNIVSDLHEDELVEMLMLHKPPLDRMIERLEESGAVSKGALQSAVDEAKKRGEDPYIWLVKHGLLSAAVLQRFFNAPGNTITRYCALFLALFILNHNRILSENDYKALLKKIPADTPQATADEVHKALRTKEEQLAEKVEEQVNLPDVSLPNSQIDEALFDKFSASLIRRKIFVPLYEDNRSIGIATADPLNLNLAVLIRWITGKWTHTYFAPEGDLIDRINAHYEGKSPEELVRPAVGQATLGGTNGRAGIAPAQPPAAAPAAAQAKPPARAADKEEPKKDGRRGDLEATVAPATRLNRTLPVDSRSAVQLVTSLIESALDPTVGATDIHLEPARDHMTVRFRIDGLMRRIVTVPGDLVGPVTSRVKVLAGMDVTERRRPQDGHIHLEVGARPVDLRVNTIPAIFGEKVAIRILDSRRLMTGLAQVGFNEKQLKTVHSVIHRPYGMVVVAGPTGSGKTSTLYAALSELNSEENHLVTIEDPVEYQLDGINQVQVDAAIGVTFSAGLRAILRQDPNVIMVGEIRDTDTAQTAIRAALTGHLVLTTLHTNTALGAVQALGNLGVSTYMLGSALAGIISQRLVRKLCPECSKKKAVTKAMAEQLGLSPNSKLKLSSAVGCDACFGSGYRGREGIFEVVEVTDRLRHAILNEVHDEQLFEIADAEGRQPMLSAGLEKVKAGVTSPEELIEKVMLEA